MKSAAELLRPNGAAARTKKEQRWSSTGGEARAACSRRVQFCYTPIAKFTGRRKDLIVAIVFTAGPINENV